MGDYNVNTLEETYERKSLIQDFIHIFHCIIITN